MPPARQPSWSTPYPLYDPSGRSPECLPHRTPGVLRSTMSCVSWRMAHAILAALREAVESACRVRHMKLAEQDQCLDASQLKIGSKTLQLAFGIRHRRFD